MLPLSWAFAAGWQCHRRSLRRRRACLRIGQNVPNLIRLLFGRLRLFREGFRDGSETRGLGLAGHSPAQISPFLESTDRGPQGAFDAIIVLHEEALW
jgi:hypothetical protein